MREKSTAQLVIRMKPSVKELLDEQAKMLGVSKAELIEAWVLANFAEKQKEKMTLVGRYLQ